MTRRLPIPLTWFAWGCLAGSIADRRWGEDAASRALVVVAWGFVFPPVAFWALFFAKPKVKRPAASVARDR